MSNPPKIISQSIKELTFKYAEDLYGLYINGEFFGVLNEEFSAEYQVNWNDTRTGDLLNALSVGGNAEGSGGAKLEDLFALGGVRTGKGFGLGAKKVFDNADYFSWTANVTLVDWDDTGIVWEKYEKLKSLSLPKVVTDSGALSGIASSVISSASGGVGSLLANAATNLAISGGVAAAGGTIDQEAYEGALARRVVRAPDPVHVQIGRYASTQGSTPISTMKMVIRTVGSTFSKEFIKSGAMYVIFSIGFESVEPLTYEANPVGGSRVTIVE